MTPNVRLVVGQDELQGHQYSRPTQKRRYCMTAARSILLKESGLLMILGSGKISRATAVLTYVQSTAFVVFH
jgi:hypothetical protein